MKALAVFIIGVLLTGCTIDFEPAPIAPGLEARPLTRVMITIPTRSGITQRLLIVEAEGRSRGTLIVFPGGNGTAHFREDRVGFRLSDNFLVRSSHLVAHESYSTAVVDVPSDRAAGMSDGFRTSPQHLSDIRAILDALATMGKEPLYLVGNSQGTLSVAFLATAIRDDRLKGIVLTASYDYVESLAIEKIRYPILVVHHRDDECHVSPYATARRQFDRMTSSMRKNLVTITGGDRVKSQPCRALSYHGFFGKESVVVEAITEWLGSLPP